MLSICDKRTNQIREDLYSSAIFKSATKRPHHGNVNATVVKKPKITTDLNVYHLGNVSFAVLKTFGSI